jgi:predicted small metal-binding protein
MEIQGQAIAKESEVFSFKCSHGGIRGCQWGATANTEELLIYQIEVHAQTSHNLIVDSNGKEKIRASVKRATCSRKTS